MPDTTEPNERAVIGDNKAPPHEAWMEHADDLAERAESLSTITNDAQAESVGSLAEEIKTAIRDAKKAHKTAKQPHLDAGRAVDASFKPVTDKLDRIKGVTQELLTPWIDQKREAERKAAAEARAVAEAADEKARRLAVAADQTDIVEVEAAAQAEADAKVAMQEAKNAKVKPATVKGVKFKTYHTPEIVDRHALLTHIAKNDPDAMTAFAADWMRRAVNGGARNIPGVNITEEKRAV